MGYPRDPFAFRRPSNVETVVHKIKTGQDLNCQKAEIAREIRRRQDEERINRYVKESSRKPLVSALPAGRRPSPKKPAQDFVFAITKESR
jgi:hypothetical protein